MKSWFFLAASVAMVLVVTGCADQASPVRSVAQKPARSQSSYAPNYGQNNPTAPVAAQPWQPGNVISASPYVAQPLPVKDKDKVKTAILLPLSGPNAALGQAMLNAAQQAVFDSAGENFELQPRDTAGDGGAAEAAHAAINGGAKLIIGPLFAADVAAVKAVASDSHVPMLPLSTDTSLAEHGVYVMGLAPGAQVERVVAYAVAHGAKHFAAIVPSNPYGTLVGQIFMTSVQQHGGILVDYETTGALTSGSEALKGLSFKHGEIDALFLPLAGDDAKKFLDMLTIAGFDNVHTHLLGTGLWDGTDIGHQSPLVIGGWYAAPDPAGRRAFVTAYKTAYGAEPPRLATLAYDATALAAILAKHNSHYDDAAMTNPNGFAGLDGIFRLTANGTVERMLAVNEVTKDGAHLIDSAPTSFVGIK